MWCCQPGGPQLPRQKQAKWIDSAGERREEHMGTLTPLPKNSREPGGRRRGGISGVFVFCLFSCITPGNALGSKGHSRFMAGVVASRDQTWSFLLAKQTNVGAKGAVGQKGFAEPSLPPDWTILRPLPFACTGPAHIPVPYTQLHSSLPRWEMCCFQRPLTEPQTQTRNFS